MDRDQMSRVTSPVALPAFADRVANTRTWVATRAPPLGAIIQYLADLSERHSSDPRRELCKRLGVSVELESGPRYAVQAYAQQLALEWARLVSLGHTVLLVAGSSLLCTTSRWCPDQCIWLCNVICLSHGWREDQSDPRAPCYIVREGVFHEKALVKGLGAFPPQASVVALAYGLTSVPRWTPDGLLTQSMLR
jgi:hypothetical protein